jgi:hypothetical protein
MQYFKGDDNEVKMAASATTILDQIEMQLDAFENGAYQCFELGDLLVESNRAPLSQAMLQSIFREAFSTIFGSFIVAGTFESYLTVFRNIFGEDVDVTFTVPAAGKLQIDVVAPGLIESDFVSRYIESNSYLYDTMVDDVDDTIIFQTVKGFESQYELEQMLFEMVPAGIYTEISLTVGA